MTMMLYAGNTKGHHFLNWFDFNTVKNAQCIVSNIFLEEKVDCVRDADVSNSYIVSTNFPLWAWNCINAFLFFPLYGVKAAVLIDCASEAMNVFIKMHHHCTNRSYLVFCNWLNWRLAKIKALFNNEIDCTTRENTLKVLGLADIAEGIMWK